MTEENDSGLEASVEGPSKRKKSVNIQVDLDDSVAQGAYANLAISNFSQEEFVLDFVFLQPKMTKGRIRSRVILSPNNAKRLAQLLTANVKEYESAFGSISNMPPQAGINLSFN